MVRSGDSMRGRIEQVGVRVLIDAQSHTGMWKEVKLAFGKQADFVYSSTAIESPASSHLRQNLQQALGHIVTRGWHLTLSVARIAAVLRRCYRIRRHHGEPRSPRGLPATAAHGAGKQGGGAVVTFVAAGDHEMQALSVEFSRRPLQPPVLLHCVQRIIACVNIASQVAELLAQVNAPGEAQQQRHAAAVQQLCKDFMLAVTVGDGTLGRKKAEVNQQDRAVLLGGAFAPVAARLVQLHTALEL